MIAFLSPLLLLPLLGCGMGDEPLSKVDSASIPASPNYIRHVKPILDHHCMSCHNGGSIDLSTYTNAKNLAPLVAAQIKKNSMPKGAGDRVSVVEKETIYRWIAQGTPELASGATTAARDASIEDEEVP